MLSFIIIIRSCTKLLKCTITDVYMLHFFSLHPNVHLLLQISILSKPRHQKVFQENTRYTPTLHRPKCRNTLETTYYGNLLWKPPFTIINVNTLKTATSKSVSRKLTLYAKLHRPKCRNTLETTYYVIFYDFDYDFLHLRTLCILYHKLFCDTKQCHKTTKI